MSVILAQCELSLSDPETSVSSRTAFLTIQRQGKRMSRLINDMLDYTRLEMRPDRYPKQNVDLSALTTSLCDDMALIRQQGIQLTQSSCDQSDLQCIQVRKRKRPYPGSFAFE